MQNKFKPWIRSVSAIVVFTFFFNDMAYGLSPTITSSEMGKSASTRDDMYALGQKLFGAKRGPGSLNLDVFKPQQFVGNAPEVPGVTFVPADYSHPPAGWENNLILQKTGLIEAFEYFRDNEAKIPADELEIREGYFDADENRGELPICRIEKHGRRYILVVHTKFVQMWDHIRSNDIWFEADIKGAKRTVSVAWGIFYRVAKHEMSDLKKDGLVSKSSGHLTYSPYRDLETIEDETTANTVSGNYSLLNDTIWMWFLGAYCFGDTTRYDNDTLARRLRWFFRASHPDLENLRKEFPSMIEADKEEAFKLACAINYHFFGDMKKVSHPLAAAEIKKPAESSRWSPPAELRKLDEIEKARHPEPGIDALPKDPLGQKIEIAFNKILDGLDAEKKSIVNNWPQEKIIPIRDILRHMDEVVLKALHVLEQEGIGAELLRTKESEGINKAFFVRIGGQQYEIRCIKNIVDLSSELVLYKGKEVICVISLRGAFQYIASEYPEPENYRIYIRYNGKKVNLFPGIAVEEFLLQRNIDKGSARVAINGRTISRDKYPIARLIEDDNLVIDEAAKPAPDLSPANMFAGDFADKIIVERTNIKGKPKGQVALRAVEVMRLRDELSNSQRKELINALKWWHVFFSATLVHPEIIDVAIDMLEGGDAWKQHWLAGQMNRVYLAISDGDINGEKTINVEGFAVASKKNGISRITCLEMRPDNRSGVYAAIRFTGVGTQLLSYAAHEEMKKLEDGLVFNVFVPRMLSRDGLTMNEKYNAADIAKYINKRSRATIDRLKLAAANGDEGARIILDALKTANSEKAAIPAANDGSDQKDSHKKPAPVHNALTPEEMERLSVQDITLDAAVKAAGLLDYKGENVKEARSALRSFFESIPESAVFIKGSAAKAESEESLSAPFSEIKEYYDDISNFPLLTHLGAVKLSVLARLGDSKAREVMINSNLRLVVAIAYKYVGVGIPVAELIEEGNISLMKAVEKYEPQQGFKFSTYASWWIKQMIRRFTRERSTIVRLPGYIRTAIGNLVKECEKKGLYFYDARTTSDEIAEATGVPLEKVEKVRRAVLENISLAASGPAVSLSDEGADAENIFATKSGETAARVDAAELASDVEKAIALLQARWHDKANRNKKILKMRVLPRLGLSDDKERTLAEVGIATGLTREMVRQIESQILDMIYSVRYTRREPVGSTGGFLNLLITKAAKALNDGRFDEAIIRTEQALRLFTRFDALKDDPLERSKFLDELNPDGNDESEFTESERIQAQSILRRAKFAAGGTSRASHRLKPLKDLTWDDEEEVLGHFKALLAELEWPVPRLIVRNGKPVKSVRTKPLNIASLKKLSDGRTPIEYYNAISSSEDLPEAYYPRIIAFAKEFGILASWVVWFRYGRQLNSIVKFVAKMPKDKTVKILVHGTFHGEDAYAIALILDRLYPDRKFEITGVDFVEPTPEGLHWAKVERVPKALRPAINKYFWHKTKKAIALKDEFRALVKLKQGDIIDPASFGKDLDIVVANAVLGQSVSSDKDIRQAVENAWSSLAPGGRFYVDNSAYHDHPNQRYVVEDIVEEHFVNTGRFRKITDSIYEKVSDNKEPYKERLRNQGLDEKAVEIILSRPDPFFFRNYYSEEKGLKVIRKAMQGINSPVILVMGGGYGAGKTSLTNEIRSQARLGVSSERIHIINEDPHRLNSSDESALERSILAEFEAALSDSNIKLVIFEGASSHALMDRIRPKLRNKLYFKVLKLFVANIADDNAAYLASDKYPFQPIRYLDIAPEPARKEMSLANSLRKYGNPKRLSGDEKIDKEVQPMLARNLEEAKAVTAAEPVVIGTSLGSTSEPSSTTRLEPKVAFINKLTKALSAIPQNKLTRKTLDVALNSKKQGIFKALSIYQRELDRRTGFSDFKSSNYRPEVSQYLMCEQATEAFCEAFSAVFKEHKVEWVRSQTGSHDWALVDDNIVVDITYGQWDDAYVCKTLVTTKDKIAKFRYLGEYKIVKEYALPITALPKITDLERKRNADRRRKAIVEILSANPYISRKELIKKLAEKGIPASMDMIKRDMADQGLKRLEKKMPKVSVKAAPSIKARDLSGSLKETYYGILGIRRDATQRQILNAFRSMAIKNHPDKLLQDKDKAQRQFIKISEAYEILKDPTLRKAYDKRLKRSARSYFNASGYDAVERDLDRNSDFNEKTRERVIWLSAEETAALLKIDLNAVDIVLTELNRRLNAKGYTSFVLKPRAGKLLPEQLGPEGVAEGIRLVGDLAKESRPLTREDLERIIALVDETAVKDTGEQRFGVWVTDLLYWYYEKSTQTVPSERALEAFTYIKRDNEIFPNGNTRTAFLLMQYTLLRAGLKTFNLRNKEAWKMFQAVDVDAIRRELLLQQPQADKIGVKAASPTVAEPLIVKIISEYIVQVYRGKGPGTNSLTQQEWENIYKAVGLFHSNKIEIFMPKEARLTEEMKEALADIRKRMGPDIVKCREYSYSGENQLEKMLGVPAQDGVKRIVIAEQSSARNITSIVKARPVLFKGVRLMPIALPENYGSMSNIEKTAQQAKIITIAIPARLLERNKTPMIEGFLRNMLEGATENPDEFINNLPESEGEASDNAQILLRVENCLKNVVSLVEKIGEELRFMKAFWTAA